MQIRLQRHARHDRQFHLGLRRLGLRLPRLFQRIHGQGRRRQAGHHAVGQRLPPAPTARISNTYTHGLVNPFGLALDPLGNFYPAIAKRNRSGSCCAAAIITASASPTTASASPRTAVDQYHDSTAIAGIAFYAADMFPKDHRDNAFVGDVVTNRVNEFRLTWKGTTPIAAKQPISCSATTVVPAGASQARTRRRPVHRRFL